MIHTSRGLPAVRHGPGGGKARTRLILVPLCCLLLVWLWVIWTIGNVGGGPNGVQFENAFATYLGGSEVLSSHGNPYDPVQVCRDQQRLLESQHVSFRQPLWNCRLALPPAVLAAFRPVSRFPYTAVALMWLACLLGLSAVGFLALLRFFGWSVRLLPCLLFLAMPPVVYGNFYGEIDALLFAALGIGLNLSRTRPFVAGSLFAFAWLKPSIGFPVIAMIILFGAVGRRFRLFGGVIAGTAVLMALNVSVGGAKGMSQWAAGLGAFSSHASEQGVQASLVSLYLYWAPTGLRVALEVLTLSVAAALVFYFWWTSRPQREATLPAPWLWVLAVLATPYLPYYDEMFLAIPILMLLGKDARHLDSGPAVYALYVMLLSVIIHFRMVGHVSLLPVPLIVLCALLVKFGPTARLKAQLA